MYKNSKGVFFSESVMRFSNLQNKYSKSLSWTWNLNFLPITVNNLFKFQAQDSDLEYSFWRFDKHIALSENKPPLVPALRGLQNAVTTIREFYFMY